MHNPFRYEVIWETRIAPGATYYSGAKEVITESDDVEHISQIAKRIIARDLMISTWCIRIIEVNCLGAAK